MEDSYNRIIKKFQNNNYLVSQYRHQLIKKLSLRKKAAVYILCVFLNLYCYFPQNKPYFYHVSYKTIGFLSIYSLNTVSRWINTLVKWGYLFRKKSSDLHCYLFLLNFDKIEDELNNFDLTEDYDSILNFNMYDSLFLEVKHLIEVEIFTYFDSDDSCFYDAVNVNCNI